MKIPARILLALVTAAFAAAAGAASTDISTSPLEIGAASTVVKPNVMLLFDDSGSMAWDFMPDWIGPSPLPGCGVNKPRSANRPYCGGSYDTTGNQGDPPYYSYQFNGVYYNPNVYYAPGVTSTGASMTFYNAANTNNWTNVPNDAYGVIAGSTDLVGGFPEEVYCNSSSARPPSASCKRNGVDTTNPFLYNMGSASNGYPDAVLGSGSGSITVNLNGSATVSAIKGSYEYPQTQNGNFFYYTITPAEYCSDAGLTTCTWSTTATGAYTNPAPIRYCLQYGDANSDAAVTGTTTVTWSSTPQPRCQKKYNQRLGYQYPRFGYFNRYDILASTPTYTRSVSRVDCAAAPTCTYAEEMTNIANWYTYYHARIQMAKTAVGTSLNTLTSSYRLGYITINAYARGGLDSTKFVPIADFTPAQRTTFYNSFYALPAGNGTPLREALSRVGQYYGGLTRSSALDYGMINSTNYPDPVQYSCQQNFTILTTDGYWNGNAGQDLSGNSIDDGAAQGNQDNNTSNVFEQRVSSVYGPGGYYDGNLTDSSFNGSNYTSIGTLADIAMYYYKTDLRPAGSTNYNTGIDVSTDDVPTAQNVDQNPAQHMVTYTIGLGVDGYLTYDTSSTNPTYLSADYLSIVNGTTGACVWTPGNVCNWPQVPVGTGYNDDPAKDDDLWHAAVNGRGSYLSAKNPQSLVRGLARDLATIQAQVGAAAASATSTPNITQTNDSIYSTTFQSSYWNGEITAQTINLTTGAVNPGVVWTESTNLINRVAAAGDTRTIYTLSSTGALIPFLFGSLDLTAQGWFTNSCGAPPLSPPLLSQCSSLAGSDQSIDNVGANMVNYLRGQSLYADGIHYRSRTQTNGNITNVLGDLVDSRPAVVSSPMRQYADAPIPPGNQNYATYAANNATRESVIYVGANDGMLHAFDSTTGNELWAYAPRMLLSGLYALADVAYPTQHRYFVDGSPEVADVLSATDGTWHTILVSGMDDGGRGYFALDVTVPTAPVLLWEFCSSATLCPAHNDANLGLSFGNPVITKRAYDGKWVVLLSSGYNNVGPGDGMGHLFELDPFTGAELASVSTGVGSTTAPSGFSRITALVTNPNTNNTVKTVYGGDLQGNLWRINMATATPTVTLMATLKDASGLPQPITARPEVGEVNSYPVVYVGTGRLLGLSDLQNPATLSPPGNWSYVGSVYALLDNGANLGNPRSQASIVQQTLSSYSATQLSVSNNPVSIPANIGWYVDLLGTGERVNIDPQLVQGTLVVASNVPISGACSGSGNSYLYFFNFASGSAAGGAATVATETVGNMTVGFTTVGLPSGQLVVISKYGNGGSGTSPLPPGGSGSTVRHVGWHGVSQ